MGLSDAPKPRRSIAITLFVFERSGAIACHVKLDVAKPCSKRIGRPCPLSTTARRSGPDGVLTVCIWTSDSWVATNGAQEATIAQSAISPPIRKPRRAYPRASDKAKFCICRALRFEVKGQFRREGSYATVEKHLIILFEKMSPVARVCVTVQKSMVDILCGRLFCVPLCGFFLVHFSS